MIRRVGVLVSGVLLAFALAGFAGAATSTIDDGEESSIVIGPDGFPIVAYTNISGELKVADCADSS